MPGQGRGETSQSEAHGETWDLGLESEGVWAGQCMGLSPDLWALTPTPGSQCQNRVQEWDAWLVPQTCPMGEPAPYPMSRVGSPVRRAGKWE